MEAIYLKSPDFVWNQGWGPRPERFCSQSSRGLVLQNRCFVSKVSVGWTVT